MTKFNTRFSEALALMLVVTLAPSSIAFAQTASVNAETSTDTTVDTDNTQTKSKTRADVKARLDAIKEKRTDRIKDEIRTNVRDVVSDVDRRIDLTFHGQADGWAIVGGTAHKSSLSLAGNAHHVGGGNWKIKSEGELTVADKHAKLDLSGFARGNIIHLQGSGSLDNGEHFRITLKGHFAPTSDDNVYAIAFTNAGIHYTNNGIRVPLMLVGSVTVVDTTPVPEPLPAEQQ
jgi:hypothetical protein